MTTDRTSGDRFFLLVGWVERSEGPPSGDADRRWAFAALDPPYEGNAAGEASP